MGTLLSWPSKASEVMCPHAVLYVLWRGIFHPKQYPALERRVWYILLLNRFQRYVMRVNLEALRAFMQVQHCRLTSSHVQFGVPSAEVMQIFKTAAEDVRHAELFGTLTEAYL